MKIRFAKKIWNRATNKMSPYWLNKFVKADKLIIVLHKLQENLQNGKLII